MEHTALSRCHSRSGRAAAHGPLVLLVGLMLLAGLSCSPGVAKRVETVPPEQAARLAEAQGLASRGDYLSLRKAVAVYDELLLVPGLEKRAAAPSIEARLMLDLRKKTLGIVDPSVLEKAARLVSADRGLSGYSALINTASRMKPRTRGVLQDISTSSWNEQAWNEHLAAVDELRRTWPGSAPAAAILLAYDCLEGLHRENRIGPDAIAGKFPDSVLVLYQKAVCTNSESALEGLLTRFPDLGEVHYHLGDLALKKGFLLEAEKQFLAARPAVPDSPHIPMLLAGIRFAMEEFEDSLVLYDETLAMAPEYRDAMLGKAISLGYLGRHDEAIAGLQRILDLGYWLIGESNYWIAWNLREKGVREGALEHAEEAMKRLPTDAGVFCLAGQIAAEGGSIDKAEKYFRESLSYDPANSDALFGLGGLMSKTGRWAEASPCFVKAAAALTASRQAAERKIEEIMEAPLTEGRKAAMISRKKKQIERLELATAAAFHDGAVAALNSGDKARAVKLAGKAAEHPAFKDRAEAILKSAR